MKLKSKVAVITGGATGIGRVSSQLFAREGARIVIVDINQNGGNDTVDIIKESGGEAVFVHADISSVTEIEEMINRAVSTYGHLDIFFHNAGVAGPGSLESTSEPDYDRTMAVNLKAGFFGAKCAVPHLKASGGGSILFTSSGLGLRPSVQSPTYSITKAGLVMLTRVLAVALSDYNIRVNAICPGPIASTPLFDDFAKQNPEVEPEEYRRKTIAARPIKRFGTPEEVAAAALFLVSPDSSYITGVALAVDGGAAAA
jgi:NAD(P)-dependent dehydrogenase (short-subunit alcohol dehydrogenase family)